VAFGGGWSRQGSGKDHFVERCWNGFSCWCFSSWLEPTWNIFAVEVPTWQGFLLFFLVELAAKVRLVLSSVNHRCRLWALQNWWSIHLHYNGKCMNMHGMFQWHFLRFEDGFVKFYVAAQEVAFCCSGHHFFVYIDPCLEGLRIIVELSGHVHCLSRYCHSPSAVLWWNETWFNEFAEFSEAIISFIEADQWILAIFEAWSECMDADGFFPRAAVGYSCCWQVQIGNAGHLPHLLTFSSCKSWPEGDYLIILYLIALRFPERSEVFVHLHSEDRCLWTKYSCMIKRVACLTFHGDGIQLSKQCISVRWWSWFKWEMFSNIFWHKARAEMAFKSVESDGETDSKVLRHTIRKEASWKHWILWGCWDYCDSWDCCGSYVW